MKTEQEIKDNIDHLFLIDLKKTHWKCRCGVVAMPLTDQTNCKCTDIYDTEWTYIDPSNTLMSELKEGISYNDDLCGEDCVLLCCDEEDTRFGCAYYHKWLQKITIEKRERYIRCFNCRKENK